MKNFVIMLNKRFPKDKVYFEHTSIATNYQELIAADSKIHIVKQNFAIWAKKVREINSGKAVLSLRYTDGSNNSKDAKQVEFLRFSGGAVGVEKLVYKYPNKVFINDIEVDLEILCLNEGLTIERFKDLYKLNGSYPMALIHLTPFRYADCGYSDIYQRYTSLRKNVVKFGLQSEKIQTQINAQIAYLVSRLKQFERYNKN